MKQIKQNLSEELNKMQYLLGYKRGQVISEQALAEDDTNVYRDADGGTYQKGGTNPGNTTSGDQNKPIKQVVIDAGFDWNKVKQEFGSTGSAADNTMLSRAWKQGGWRPGQPVPEPYRLKTYKPAVITTTSTTVSDNSQTIGGEQKPLEQQNSDITTPEQAQAAIEKAKAEAEKAAQQAKVDKEMCRTIGRAVNPINPFKKEVATQELCDALRKCISQGFIGRDEKVFSACQSFPPKNTQQVGGEQKPAEGNQTPTNPGTGQPVVNKG